VWLALRARRRPASAVTPPPFSIRPMIASGGPAGPPSLPSASWRWRLAVGGRCLAPGGRCLAAGGRYLAAGAAQCRNRRCPIVAPM